jgi:hypothetical protein
MPMPYGEHVLTEEGWQELEARVAGLVSTVLTM